MKKFSQFGLFVALASASVFAQAQFTSPNAPISSVPEIDGGLAVLGLGLLSGILAIAAERRGK
ncbi:MAG: hypothetical protein ABSB19_18440 [Methylomonas sp.]